MAIDHLVVRFTSTYLITTKIVSLNPVHGEVYLIQLHSIKFVFDLRQVCVFLQVLWFSPPIKLKLKVVLNTHNLSTFRFVSFIAVLT